MAFDFRLHVKDIILKNGYRRLAEIGVWMGDLSRILWSLPSTDYLLLVDAFDVKRSEATKNKKTQKELDESCARLIAEKPASTEVIVMPSVEAAKHVDDKSLDFVFIDASHTYKACREDIEVWRPKVRAGGMLAGDDYNTKRFPGVVRAVNELLPTSTHDSRVWYLKL